VACSLLGLSLYLSPSRGHRPHFSYSSHCLTQANPGTSVSGERMPRRPVHPGASVGFVARILEMLKDGRTWTLIYFLLMLPLGILSVWVVDVDGPPPVLLE
jgi:hypothetical protein